MSRRNRLKSVIDPLPGSARYYANNTISLQQLAIYIEALPETTKSELATLLTIYRVMFPPIWLRAMIRVAAWWKGMAPDRAWFLLFTGSAQGRQVAKSVVSDTVHWMLHGQDREDDDSVGGFSQREINFIANFICLKGYGERIEGNA